VHEVGTHQTGCAYGVPASAQPPALRGSADRLVRLDCHTRKVLGLCRRAYSLRRAHRSHRQLGDTRGDRGRTAPR
jgi:hypothetical protein